MYNQKNIIYSRYFVFIFFIFGLSLSGIGFSQIKVKEINLKQISELISKREAKPFLINIWATWCVPCREEFPDLVKLAKKYKGKADIAGISVDFPDEIESKILPFVKKLNVNFPIYVNSESEQEKLINYFDKNWNGAIPATFIFNSKGDIVQSIYGKKDFKYFDEVLKKYLK